MSREKTKAELWEVINNQKAVIDRQLHTLDEFGAMIREANKKERTLQDQLSSQRRVHAKEIKELQDTMRNHRGRVGKALDAAEEGSHAAGLISRVAYRLLEENDTLRRLSK
jgi:uncharacterized protein YhaN